MVKVWPESIEDFKEPFAEFRDKRSYERKIWRVPVTDVRPYGV